MARRGQSVDNEPSPFEPGLNVATPDQLEVKAPPVLAEPKKLPRAIMLDEPIGWMDGGVLCMFREEQLVTNPIDIKRLIQHGAQYRTVS